MAELNQIKYPDITTGLAAYARFYDVGQKMQERNALSEAGGLYAQGDKQGAVNSLAQAGQLDEATALEKSLRDATRQADADKLAKAQRFNEVLGNLVMTVKGLPPERQPAAWNTAIDVAKGAGLDVEKYRDPGTMDFILAQANKTGELLKLELDRRKAEATGAGKAPSGYRFTPDGNMTFIPGGPADPAKAVSDAKYSEGASKAANFANMMNTAESQLTGVTENPIGFFGTLRETLPEGAANIGRSSAYQQYRQAAMQWVRAKLRKESGAAISNSEFEGEFQTFFPQYGDSKEVIEQKNAARKQAQLGMEAESRGAYKQMFGGDRQQPASARQPSQPAASAAEAPYPGARKAPDGHWYVEKDGKFFRVDQ